MAIGPQSAQFRAPRWRDCLALFGVMAVSIGFTIMFVRGAWINWPDSVTSLQSVAGRVTAVMPFARPKPEGRGRGWHIVVDGRTAAPLEVAYGRLTEAEIKALPGQHITALVGGERYIYRRKIFELVIGGKKLLNVDSERSLDKQQAGFQIVFGTILGVFWLCLLIYEFQAMTGRIRRWTS